ncbi:glycosyltransferase [Actinomyces qiguomingii]|uniref:glycosyltransferase n=1 Tax=Actinomyces qiguomingii TaxID=2057800 RepID=UPI000CA08903|nr:glycosyltransferase [Actinomyces qiguomingii]
MSHRPTILVISFSPIARDSRVLREISALAEVGEVTTVGYGPTPPHAANHLQIPDSAPSLPQTPSGVLKLATRRLRSSETAAPAARAAIRLVGDARFDMIVANDARAIPTAFAVAHGAPVWADMHEWAPEERTHVTSWRLLVAPLMDHICRTYLPRCAAVTTVGGEIADLYRRHYGVTPELVRNAAPFADLSPTTVSSDGSLRLVHSGGAVAGRNIEAMIDAVKRLDERFTLDLYLVAGGDGGTYLSSLKERAADCDRIFFREPVAPGDLPETLNQYDVGVYWIPPFNTNARLALPNKIFDFIQARLAVAVGPAVEMTRVVRSFKIGVSSSGNDVSDIVATLSALTPEKVSRYKQATDRAAHELSFEHEKQTIHTIVNELTAPTSH